jgi:hypothetical protein
MSLARRSLLLAALPLLGLAAPAQAVPLYFGGNLGVGFDPSDPAVVGEGIDVVMDGSYAFVTPPQVDVSLVGVPTVPGTIDFATPITATVQYTVTNDTGSVLDDEHLAFTYGGNLGAWPELTPDEFGLDVPGLVLVQQASCTGNPVGPCVFGAVALPVMAPGAVHQFTLTHLMADTLSGSTVVPSPGLALLQHTAVPEPGEALLCAIGLAGLAAAGRVRRG